MSRRSLFFLLHKKPPVTPKPREVFVLPDFHALRRRHKHAVRFLNVVSLIKLIEIHNNAVGTDFVRAVIVRFGLINWKNGIVDLRK